jgi:glycosyltransferase involved in cell wall biosynthesis
MNDLVVSTKLLDYCAAGVPVLATRTRVQAKLLGDDYPLFVGGPDEAFDVLERALADPDLQQMAVTRTLEAASGFTYERIAASFAPHLVLDGTA